MDLQPALLKYSRRMNIQSKEITFFLLSLYFFLKEVGEAIIFQRNILL